MTKKYTILTPADESYYTVNRIFTNGVVGGNICRCGQFRDAQIIADSLEERASLIDRAKGDSDLRKWAVEQVAISGVQTSILDITACAAALVSFVTKERNK